MTVLNGTNLRADSKPKCAEIQAINRVLSLLERLKLTPFMTVLYFPIGAISAIKYGCMRKDAECKRKPTGLRIEFDDCREVAVKVGVRRAVPVQELQKRLSFIFIFLKYLSNFKHYNI
jgi:hypothetical protein